ncbi:C4-dicarboxylate TRAP transporter substrate-binding protein [Salinarimonas ramus]|uniref:C4-dicarboxylate ABC transporter n=1 Tax=Salinarimonas ramus TaxID=690164 RepID=A0A917V829_9HYPH|nr:C4-dicarboxylate TRAP transporter substrate-binding protein [Salinarimonas ramus]GGK49142.1 C4-dicarboxylate ABC transporter [Salinarimonas ramus]
MRKVATLAATLVALVGGTALASADTIRLRIASGHPAVNTYVNLMETFFVPEVSRRVAERTDHTVEFIEGYGGSMVKVADTLEAVQSGIVDIGGFCFCFEPSNLPLHAFQVMLPFGTMSPEQSVAVARAVYDRVPFLEEAFEERYDQVLLALIADNGYNLVTNFAWGSVEDLQGEKLAGAGLNLKWLEYAGAVPVQSSLVDAYTSLQTGVYDGWIMFPSGVVNFKLHEVANHYTEIGFGSITWHGLTMNQSRFESLPEDVREIVLEVAREYEAMTGTRNQEDYPEQLEQLRELGATVTTLPDSVRADWARSLAAWPAEKAAELDAAGMPASEVLSIALEEAEKLGYVWPVRYELD